MNTPEQKYDSPHRRVGLLTVLLLTLLCLIPIRLFVIGTYYISHDACTSPAFAPNSLLIVRYTKSPRLEGERLIFSYSDSLRQHRLAPAQVVQYWDKGEDSLVVSTCSDTLLIPRSAVKGKVISVLHL